MKQEQNVEFLKVLRCHLNINICMYYTTTLRGTKLAHFLYNPTKINSGILNL